MRRQNSPPRDSHSAPDKKRGGKNQPRSKRSGAGKPKTQDGGDHLFLFGIHTVKAALENTARKKHVLYATENALPRLGLVANTHVTGFSIEVCPSKTLDQLVGADAVHQGAVLKCAPLDTLDASELFHLASARLIVVLDQITDPHNAGAILRSACAIGVDAVLTTSRNSAHETAVLAKSASGALDHVKLVQLRNLSKGLIELNEMGFTSIGLDSEGPLVLEDTLDTSEAGKVVLVLGSENKGLREKTRESCTALARLDMPGPIRSLNVSNAATLSLYLVAAHLRKMSR